MGYHATNERPELIDHPPKNRVMGSEAFSFSRTGSTWSETQCSRPENHPTVTTTASGMCFYGYRFYSPKLGMWINRDPIEEISFRTVNFNLNKSLSASRSLGRGSNYASRGNEYLFVLNKPISSVDYLGLRSLQDILHCTDPKVWREKPGAGPPGSNGCSLPPPFSWVYDPNNPSGNALFEDSCNGHDECYGNCSMPKSVCDSVFHNSMQAACNGAGLTGAALSDCLSWADTYLWGVSGSIGQGHYDDAQNDRCECQCP